MKIGLLGGAFDPVRLGHIEVALAVAGYVDQVWLLPCYGHLYGKRPADPHHRIHMCQLAIEGLPKLAVSDFEIAEKSEGVAYHTLVEMTKRFGHEFQFVIGQDNADTIAKWRFSDRLIKEFAFIVISCGQPGLDWYRQPPHTFIDAPVSGLRSTDIRQMLREHNPQVAQYLAPSVLHYIDEHNLYES